MISFNKSGFSSDDKAGSGLGLIFRTSLNSFFRLNFSYSYTSSVKDKPENAEKDFTNSDFIMNFKPSQKFILSRNNLTNFYSAISGIYQYKVNRSEGENFTGPIKTKVLQSFGFGLAAGAELSLLRSIGIAFEYELPLKWTFGTYTVESGSNIQTSNEPRIFSSSLTNSELSLIITFYF